MRILSFDQATAITGWAEFQDGEMISHGKINLKKNKDTDERVQEMIMSIWMLIRESNPDVVVIEDVAMQKDAQALIKLARIQGGVLSLCAAANIGCDILRPSVWRKILEFRQGKAVSRPELKRQAKEYVMEHFNLKATEDEADAICIGCAAVKKYIEGDN